MRNSSGEVPIDSRRGKVGKGIEVRLSKHSLKVCYVCINRLMRPTPKIGRHPHTIDDMASTLSVQSIIFSRAPHVMPKAQGASHQPGADETTTSKNGVPQDCLSLRESKRSIPFSP